MDKKFYADADSDANGIRPKNNMSPTLLQHQSIDVFTHFK